MKKYIFALVGFLFLTNTIFAQSTFHSIKATSSSENPNVINVESSYKHIDDNGVVSEDKKTERFNTEDNAFYTIQHKGNGSADVEIKKVDNRQKSKQSVAKPIRSMESIFDDFDSFDDMFDDVFKDMPDFDDFGFSDDFDKMFNAPQTKAPKKVQQIIQKRQPKQIVNKPVQKKQPVQKYNRVNKEPMRNQPVVNFNQNPHNPKSLIDICRDKIRKVFSAF